MLQLKDTSVSQRKCTQKKCLWMHQVLHRNVEPLRCVKHTLDFCFDDTFLKSQLLLCILFGLYISMYITIDLSLKYWNTLRWLQTSLFHSKHSVLLTYCIQIYLSFLFLENKSFTTIVNGIKMLIAYCNVQITNEWLSSDGSFQPLG